MATYEEALDNITLKESEIVSRQKTDNLILDLYNVISEKCENGALLNELNGIERVFYLCLVYEIGMNNGGIDQYYRNSSGDYANETVEALIEIGAQHTALILDKGNSVFRNGIVPENQDERIIELDEMEYKDVFWLFDELDRQFNECVDHLEELNLKYVLNNKEAFM